MGVKGDWIQQFGLLGVVQGRAQSGEGACHYCLFSSVCLLSLLAVFVCCTCTCMHRDLVVSFSRIIQKSSYFIKSSLTYSNIFAGSCSRHVALGGILISLWKSLLTSSLWVGFCFQRGKQTGTVHNPLSSLPPWHQSWTPLCS